MRKKWFRRAIGIAAGLFVLVLGFLGFTAYYHLVWAGETEKVTFKSGEISIAGLLVKPNGNAPYPAVVILHGSGTFSGAGGSCLGYRMAGLNVRWANEFEPHAVETYRLNHPRTPLCTKDIREVSGQEVLDACGGSVDVLDGSPPCQSFSLSGSRQKGWGKEIAHADGTKQVSDDLFWEYARLLEEVRPRAFVAENVYGMVIGVAKGYFREILALLRSKGYRVVARVLDAQWLGVPQKRKRVIFIGFREDLGLDPVHPSPLPYRYSIREACPWIVGMTRRDHGKDEGSDLESWQQKSVDEPSQTIVTGPRAGRTYKCADPYFVRDPDLARNGAGKTVDEPSQTITTRVGGGGAGFQSQLPDVQRDPEVEPEAWLTGNVRKTWLRSEKGDKDFNFIKMREDEPSNTLAAMWGQGSSLKCATLGREPRKFSIAELRRVCAFPDDFQLPGGYGKQWARLGNSVPPIMMRAIATCVRDSLLGHDRKQEASE